MTMQTPLDVAPAVYRALFDASVAEPYGTARAAYDDYCAVTPDPLAFVDWLGALAQVAGHLDAPCVAIQSHEACTPLRPQLRYIK